jgi:hypothetical protein
MARYLVVLDYPHDRELAIKAIRQAPDGARVELKAARRSLPQNDRMWAMLTDIATQKEHGGRKYTPDQWKIIFMAAAGREVQFIPSLDGKTFLPWGQSSSDLSKQEMSDLIEFMLAWGAENSVVFHDGEAPAAEVAA